MAESLHTAVFANTDPAHWATLPDSARVRLLAVRDAKENAFAALQAISQNMDDLRIRREAAKAELDNQIESQYGHRRNSLRIGEEDLPAWWKERAKRIEALSAEYRRLEERCTKATEISNPAGRLLSALESYLQNCGGSFREAPVVQAEPRKNESREAAIEARRRRVRELIADRKAVEVAPYPSSLAKEKAAAQLAALVEAGRPNLQSTVDHGEQFRFPTVMVRGTAIPGPGHTVAEQVDTIATLAWLFPTYFQDAINREIDACADDAAALTDDQRKKKLAEIDRDRLAIEREEVVLCEGAGATLRADVDPRAALGLADDMPAPR